MLAAVRPERVDDREGPRRCAADGSRLSGTVAQVVYLGTLTQFHVDTATGGRRIVHRLSSDGQRRVEAGDKVTLTWPPRTRRSFASAPATDHRTRGHSLAAVVDARRDRAPGSPSSRSDHGTAQVLQVDALGERLQRADGPRRRLVQGVCAPTCLRGPTDRGALGSIDPRDRGARLRRGPPMALDGRRRRCISSSRQPACEVARGLAQVCGAADSRGEPGRRACRPRGAGSPPRSTAGALRGITGGAAAAYIRRALRTRVVPAHVHDVVRRARRPWDPSKHPARRSAYEQRLREERRDPRPGLGRRVDRTSVLLAVRDVPLPRRIEPPASGGRVVHAAARRISGTVGVG